MIVVLMLLTIVAAMAVGFGIARVVRVRRAARASWRRAARASWPPDERYDDMLKQYYTPEMMTNALKRPPLLAKLKELP